ncbi:MAG TPA: glycosyltransferase family 39 protein [Terriglobales bacterium]
MAAVALGWVTLLAGLGGFGLLGPDEPRYAAIAAAMARTHDWITPRLWGAAWLEKPVLYYWLGGLSDRLHGAATAASSRLPNAVLALAMIAALALFLRRVCSARAAWLALFLGLTSAFVLGFGRAATTDMTLTAPLAMAMMALYLWIAERRAAWLNGAAAALALATLAKGPVAVVLAALTLIGFAATQQRWPLLRDCLRPLPILIYFALAAPWFIAVQMANHQFVREFFLQHNLERFASNRFDHPQPFWYYLPVLLLALFPWTGWLGLPLRQACCRLRARGLRRGWDGRDAPLHFWLLTWLLAPLVFFSISQSKLPGYLLPAIPAAIALISVVAARQWSSLPRWPLVISAACTALLPAAVRAAPWFVAPRAQRMPWTVLAADPGLWMLTGITLLLLLLLVYRRRPAVLVVATCIIVAVAVYTLSHGPNARAIDVALSGEPLGSQLEAQCNSGLPASCGTVPLYVWRLNRSLLYGAQFELNHEVAPWPETGPLPTNAVVLMDRSATPDFVAEFGNRFELARMSRFQPAPIDNASWIAVRVRHR